MNHSDSTRIPCHDKMNDITKYCEVEIYQDAVPKHYYKVKIETLEKEGVKCE